MLNHIAIPLFLKEKLNREIEFEGLKSNYSFFFSFIKISFISSVGVIKVLTSTFKAIDISNNNFKDG
jgi:hypothetical protein